MFSLNFVPTSVLQQNFKFSLLSADLTFEKTQKIENATFERIKPIVLGFGPLSLAIRMNPRTIGLVRSKMAFSVFHAFRPIRRSIYPGRLINFSPGMYNFSKK